MRNTTFSKLFVKIIQIKQHNFQVFYLFDMQEFLYESSPHCSFNVNIHNTKI